MSSNSSSSSKTKSNSNPLPHPNRYITNFSPTSPHPPTFSTQEAPLLPVSSLSGGIQRLAYQIPAPPIKITPTSEDDVSAYALTYKSALQPWTDPDAGDTRSLPTSLIPEAGGAGNVWYNDLPPGGEGIMHATDSMDFVVVVAGEVELVLDDGKGEDGDRRKLKVGDCVMQRGIGHRWRNASETEWARVVAVALKAEVRR